MAPVFVGCDGGDCLFCCSGAGAPAGWSPGAVLPAASLPAVVAGAVVSGWAVSCGAVAAGWGPGVCVCSSLLPSWCQRFEDAHGLAVAAAAGSPCASLLALVPVAVFPSGALVLLGAPVPVFSSVVV